MLIALFSWPAAQHAALQPVLRAAACRPRAPHLEGGRRQLSSERSSGTSIGGSTGMPCAGGQGGAAAGVGGSCHAQAAGANNIRAAAWHRPAARGDAKCRHAQAVGQRIECNATASQQAQRTSMQSREMLCCEI